MSDSDWLAYQVEAVSAALAAVDVGTAHCDIENNFTADAAASLGIFRLDRAGDRRLWELSVHEAGHAVAGSVLGLNVTRVVIRADGSGRCDSEKHGRTFSERLSCIVMQLSGFIAEQYENAAALNADRLRGKFDIIAARRELDRLGENHPLCPVPFRAASQFAAAIVYNRWPAIFRTAVALRKHHSLTGDQVRELVGESG